MSRLDRQQEKPAVTPDSSFRLDKANAKLFGVCGGIANHFGIDANLVRIGFAVGTLVGFGSLILVYLAIALIAD
ncbi:PspC domain-containing protein [Pelagerythrobacter marinus]|uniref:PspC domain-containing protein n=1 Tax=Pelagerythrobacter marinus TaxID=538382 RepID=UPI0020368FCA|nr:PspC domain-containing protein [Pelagerythrobacter marinus]USA38624.1 PspC domain-containing protein [Pelagerythrobacter marinus]WPZ07349.1 PspC domain-containing protein [Pelagerythrobacter marinus]